ncbi:hypothetical protein NBRC10513v2_000077 [Rhodotorula toruloides]
MLSARSPVTPLAVKTTISAAAELARPASVSTSKQPTTVLARLSRFFSASCDDSVTAGTTAAPDSAATAALAAVSTASTADVDRFSSNDTVSSWVQSLHLRPPQLVARLLARLVASFNHFFPHLRLQLSLPLVAHVDAPFDQVESLEPLDPISQVAGSRPPLQLEREQDLLLGRGLQRIELAGILYLPCRLPLQQRTLVAGFLALVDHLVAGILALVDHLVGSFLPHLRLVRHRLVHLRLCLAHLTGDDPDFDPFNCLEPFEPLSATYGSPFAEHFDLRTVAEEEDHERRCRERKSRKPRGDDNFGQELYPRMPVSEMYSLKFELRRQQLQPYVDEFEKRKGRRMRVSEANELKYKLLTPDVAKQPKQLSKRIAQIRDAYARENQLHEQIGGRRLRASEVPAFYCPQPLPEHAHYGMLAVEVDYNF